MGSGEFGKPRQAADEIIRQCGFSIAELLNYRMMVYWNLFHTAQAIVLATRKTGVYCVSA